MKRSMDQKLRLRNFDARHGIIETGAVVKNRKGMSGVEGGKRYLLPVERKRPVFERRRMQFPLRDSKIVRKKPEHTATPSEPTVSRGRSVSTGKSNHGSILRQPCRYYLKGTCTRSLCEYWHPPSANAIKMKRGVRLETSVCFRITRLMNNQIKLKKSYFQKRRESDDKNALAK